MKIIFMLLLPFLALFSDDMDHSLSGDAQIGGDENTGTLEKMIAARGSVEMDLNLKQLGSIRSDARTAKTGTLRFEMEQNSFFTVLVFNDELRGPLPGSARLIPQNSSALPARLNIPFRHLLIESKEWGSAYDLVVRDAKTGFIFFNIDGQQLDYNAADHLLSIHAARLLMSQEFAAELERPSEAGSIVGKVSIAANMRPIEVTRYVDGEVSSDVLPALHSPDAGTVSGPDVIVGDLSGLAQFGAGAGTQVGLAVGTDSCNFGTVDLDWFALPSNDHPVIPQNLYRMSGGASNDERFEQIGQSSVKHAFTALMNNICGLGCNGVGGTHLGSGCSDPYSASLNAGTSNALGSRAWINPFTGAYPRGDSATPPNDHTGHTHTGPSHRILVEVNDLNTSLNPGATYYAEGQYITPHEYVWCQAHTGQCNQYNNVSYRRYSVIGTASPFVFSAAAATERQKAAISAWTGATISQIEPDPGNDGIGFIGYKVTNPSPGVWHYEYAIYNQNLDRAIRSFSIPVGAGVTLTNIGFHAPPQHPGWTFDGTTGNTGYSSTPWAQTQDATTTTWSSETFAQNPNANAVRWGTLYNIRFDTDRPPTTQNATIGFLKTGAPIAVQVQAPLANVSISGQIQSPDGRGIRTAKVSLTDSHGVTRVVTTSSFGLYMFDNVATGETYTIRVSSKLYRFQSKTLTVNNTVTDLDIMGQE